MVKAKTTVLLEEALLEQAKELKINISAVAREALAAAIERRQPASDETHLVKARRDGKPVAFWGRLIAQHQDTESCAYLTNKGSVVLTSFTYPNGSRREPVETIDAIHDSGEQFFERLYYDRSIADWMNDQTVVLPGDEAFEMAIADACGITYHEVLDI